MAEITREDALAFISYLQKKENVLIEEQVIPRVTLLNTFVNCMSEQAKQILHIVKHSKTPLDAYKAVAHMTAKHNGWWTVFREGGYMFYEDREEYISNCPQPVPENVQIWIDKGGIYAHRDIFIRCFPTEYVSFLHETFGCEDYAVMQVNIDIPYGTGCLYKYLTDATRAKIRAAEYHSQYPVQADDRITLAFDGSKCNIESGDMIPLAKFICSLMDVSSALICDFNSHQVIDVRRI